tara:strand:- start:57613 stop:59223 length:1611 start_codon:yes stop_codon:yes gene_type:complete
MSTNIKFKDDARQALKEGVDMVYNAVRVSLGAEGRNVIVPTHDGGYTITKDGVSIARSIYPGDTYAAIGASLVKEAAGRTNSQAGDGTTTATVLARSIFNLGLEKIDQGTSSVELKKGIDQATKDIVEYLKHSSTEVTKETLIDVATVSANGDRELGEIISKAFNKIGEHGQVLTEESDTEETYVELREGVVLDNGYTSRIFRTDAIKDICELDEPYVLLHRGKIEKSDRIVKLFDTVFKKPHERLLIITDDIDPFVHSIIGQNVDNGSIKGRVCVVIMPQILKVQKDLLNDLAVLTGATIVSDEKGTKIGVQVLGKVKKCVASERDTVIVGDANNLNDVIKEIKDKIEDTDNKFDKEELQERLARITGGVATLYVGAKSDSELREKQDRIEDSINATRSSLEEGIVSGGGVALANLYNRMFIRVKTSWYQRMFPLLSIFFGVYKTPSSFTTGYNIVVSACLNPYHQILENAGISFKFLNQGRGIDVRTGEEVCMLEAGIIDPTKVVRCALENAASVAGTFLTTEAVIARNNEDKS